ncbi:MAG: hypothetical protein ACI9MS_003184 [Glaciecola sp.]
MPEIIFIHCLRSKSIGRVNSAKKAIAGFYKMKLDKTWQVKPSKKTLWKAEEATALIAELLSTMEIDIKLNNAFFGKRCH